MAYSCGYWHRDDPTYTLEDAQRAKLDLVCRKLGLEPGMRLLDVGCGWGSLTLHAAEHFGAQVTGVTIAAEQKRFIDARIARARPGATGSRSGCRTTARSPDGAVRRGRLDRDGRARRRRRNYPTYVEVAAPTPAARRPRADPADVARRRAHPGGGPFIESFIAPDMHMRPVGETVALIEAAGSRCVTCTRCASTTCAPSPAGWTTSRPTWTELAELVGEEVVRVWRLYLVGGAMAFRDGRMGVDQILWSGPAATHTLPAGGGWLT